MDIRELGKAWTERQIFAFLFKLRITIAIRNLFFYTPSSIFIFLINHRYTHEIVPVRAAL